MLAPILRENEIKEVNFCLLHVIFQILEKVYPEALFLYIRNRIAPVVNCVPADSKDKSDIAVFNEITRRRKIYTR